MKIRIVFSCTLLCFSILFIAGCSNVQNRTKDVSESDNTASVTLKVAERSTTVTGVTTTTLDSKTEKIITKSLTQILINGSSKKQLFSEQSFVNAPTTFANYKDATANEATVSYHLLVGDSDEESLIAAEVTQKVTLDKKMSTNTGTIYFDLTGIVIGYALE